jgi:hypothetical protein
MMKSMGISSRTSFNDFVSDCLTQENNNNLYALAKGRKRPLESGMSQPQTTIVTRPNFRPIIPGARFRPPPKKNHQHWIQGSEGIQGGPTTCQGWTRKFNRWYRSSEGTLHCGQLGHFAKSCPRPKKKNNVYPARVHLTTTDEIADGELVTTDTFFVNDHPLVVLFDSGSSHSFMSTAFAHRFNQSSEKVGHKYQISSVGADVFTNCIVRGAPSKLKE